MCLDFSPKTKNSMLLLLPPGEQWVTEWETCSWSGAWGTDGNIGEWRISFILLIHWLPHYGCGQLSMGLSAVGQENSNCKENSAPIFTGLSPRKGTALLDILLGQLLDDRTLPQSSKWFITINSVNQLLVSNRGWKPKAHYSIFHPKLYLTLST